MRERRWEEMEEFAEVERERKWVWGEMGRMGVFIEEGFGERWRL